MTGTNSGSGEGSFELHRRRLIRAAAASPVAGLALSRGVRAQSGRQITVEQGGSVVDTVVPYTYGGMNVVEFYNYDGRHRSGGGDGASANTPNDLEENGVSQLFFYEYQGRLSLVMIHDKPDSTSGGSIEMAFQGLPDSGEWTVRDDITHAPDEYGDDGTYARWQWGTCCTDGGAYSWEDTGDFEFTITPREYGGGGDGDPFDGDLHTWQLLSGDGSAEELATGESVTVSVGSPLAVGDVRVVQSFENTRYSEQQDLDTFDEGQIEDASVQHFDDGPLVDGKASAVVFDVTGTPGGSGSDVDFEVTRHYDDGSTETATITLPTSVVESASAQDDSLVGAVVDAGETGRWNVEPLEADLSRVEVTSGGGGRTAVDVSRSIADMPTLTLGFVGVHGGDAPYGTISSTQAYEDFVENTARLIQSMFPVERVDVVWADLDERHVDRTRDLIGNPLYSLTVLNAASTRRTIVDAITDTSSLLNPDDDSFADTFSIVNGSRQAGPSLDDVDSVDAVVGATPDDYLANVPSGEPTWTGIHYGGDSVQPDIAALAEVGHPMTAAQEVGHHFLGHDFFPRNVAQEDPNGPDTGHANNDLNSTKYDLTDGFSAERAAPSFMSYSASRWMDALSHEHLVSEQFSPTPRTGTLAESAIDSMFAAGSVSGGELSVWTTSLTRSRTVSDVTDADATITVTGFDGEPIEERGVQFGTTARPGHDGAPDTASDQLELDDVFVGRVPFPEDAVGLEVAVTTTVDGEERTLTTGVDPISGMLREAIEALPEAAVDNYRGFVESNLERLDTVERHALAGRYRNAVTVLDAVEKSVRQHVDAEYDTGEAATLSKQQLLTLIDGYRGRLESQVNGRGNGK